MRLCLLSKRRREAFGLVFCNSSDTGAQLPLRQLYRPFRVPADAGVHSVQKSFFLRFPLSDEIQCRLEIADGVGIVHGNAADAPVTERFVCDHIFQPDRIEVSQVDILAIV